MVNKKEIKFKTVTLCCTKQNKDIFSIAGQCCEVLSNRGLKVLVEKNLSKLVSNGAKVSSEGLI